MSLRILGLCVFSSVLVASLSGCITTPMDLEGVSGSSASSPDAVPVFSAKVAYFTVAPPDPTSDDTPFMRSFRQSFANQTIVMDDANPDRPSMMCTHSYEEMDAKYAEMKTPNLITCAAAKPGTQTMPAGFDKTWAGSEQGGCGTWAVATCNRILGDTPASSAVTKDEWNAIAKDIKQDDQGASTQVNITKYYKDKGYCVVNKRLDGTRAEYEEITKKHNDGCDIKLIFAKRMPDGSYVNGHHETITGASSAGVTTNSWGKQAVIEGGSKGGFKHSEDGKSFKDTNGNPLWPADSTDVSVSYVCKCNVFEKIAHAVSGG